MADRVYPSAKPTLNGTTTAAVNPAFPATKAQLYNVNRPAYRPQPPRRSRRSCCCSCCLWTTVTILIVLVLAAVAGGVLWAIYRPQRPNFSVFSFQVSQFNLTSTSHLTSKFNLAITARNPNKELVFLYDPIEVSLTSGEVDVGDGSIPAFVHGTRNTTTLKTAISSAGQSLDTSLAASLRSDLRNRNGMPLKIQLDTKVQVKMGGLETKKVGIRILCDGIRATVPTGKSATTARTTNAKCKVDLRVKIWKWTL